MSTDINIVAQSVFASQAYAAFYNCNALDLLRDMCDDSVDIVVTSPPYEDARAYRGHCNGLVGEEWVSWMKEVFLECVRVCRGAVCFVVEGRTRNFEYSGIPFLLFTDLLRAGVKMRKPPIYKRLGICGKSDFFRNCYEPIIVGSKHGRLPWSDPTACGGPPKFKPGGDPTHRTASGERVRKGNRRPDGSREVKRYKPPERVNYGNIIDCGAGGQLGSKLAGHHEAPFPRKVPDVLIQSLCKPGGLVFDPFMGSGTTGASAIENGRNFIGVDLSREYTCLGIERIETETEALGVKCWRTYADSSWSPTSTKEVAGRVMSEDLKTEPITA